MEAWIAFFIAVTLIIFFIVKPKRKQQVETDLPENIAAILEQHVAYYRALNEADKKRFEEKVKSFLSYVRIHGVNIEIDDTDKLLVASSAVIPIFGFDDWYYNNVTDVLLYSGTFTQSGFSTTDKEANVLGMIGEGAMQNVMILSKPALRQGFSNERDKNNTGIHEFVHLLDKSDGSTDGLPEQLLSKQYTIPWLRLMADTIDDIKKGRSDFNPYGAYNKAEFFAVASEYFFERPDLFKEKHPELFQLMEQVFHQEPATIHAKKKLL
jgi:Mlc titration factor MtfA (ptsG expression regulator)